MDDQTPVVPPPQSQSSPPQPDSVETTPTITPSVTALPPESVQQGVSTPMAVVPEPAPQVMEAVIPATTQAVPVQPPETQTPMEQPPVTMPEEVSSQATSGSKLWIIVLLLLFVVGLVSSGAYYFITSQTAQSSPTLDRMVAPPSLDSSQSSPNQGFGNDSTSGETSVSDAMPTLTDGDEEDEINADIEATVLDDTEEDFMEIDAALQNLEE